MSRLKAEVESANQASAMAAVVMTIAPQTMAGIPAPSITGAAKGGPMINPAVMAL